MLWLPKVIGKNIVFLAHSSALMLPIKKARKGSWFQVFSLRAVILKRGGATPEEGAYFLGSSDPYDYKE